MKEKLFSSYRWHEPINAVQIGYEEQSKEERIKSKKKLMQILVKRGEITQEAADKRIKDFIDSFK